MNKNIGMPADRNYTNLTINRDRAEKYRDQYEASVLFDAGLFRKASKTIFCLGPKLSIMELYASREFELINLFPP